MKLATRRLLIAGLLSGILLSIGAAAIVLGSKEPRYDGRPISEWIDELAGTVNPGFGAVSSEALPKLIRQAPGDEIVPALRVTLRRGRTLLDRLYVKLYRKLPAGMAAKLEKPDPARDAQLRYRAALILYYLGTGARKAAPDLIESLKDENAEVRRVAANALGNIDNSPAVVEALNGALDDGAASVRRAVLQSFSQVAEEHAVVREAALLLQNPEAGVRTDAAQLLKNIGPGAESAIPALTAALRDENDDVLRFAAQALGKIGPEARESVPGLLRALRENRPYTRTTLRWALRKIDPEALEREQR